MGGWFRRVYDSVRWIDRREKSSGDRKQAHHGYGSGASFSANLVTSFLVIFASKWGMPVSTTHVSCGALFAIGVANGQARWNVIRTILLAWLLTLPMAALGR